MGNVNWARLVSQGRAKGIGISWSDEEVSALSGICKKTGKQMGEIAHYIRAGILTVEGYEKAEVEGKIVNPLLKLSRDELLKKTKELGINASPQATIEVLAEVVKREEEKRSKTDPDPKLKPKAKPVAKVVEKTKVEVEVKVKPIVKKKAIVKKSDKK